MNNQELRIGLTSLKQAILPAELADTDPAFTLEHMYEQIILTDAHKINVLEGQDYANKRRLVMCIHSKTLNPEYDSSLMLHRIQKAASLLRQTGFPLFVQIHTSKEETYRECIRQMKEYFPTGQADYNLVWDRQIRPQRNFVPGNTLDEGLIG